MKNIFTLLSVAAASVAVAAPLGTVSPGTTLLQNTQLSSQAGKVVSSQKLANDVRLDVTRDNNGVARKNLVGKALEGRRVAMTRAPKFAAATADTPLDEDFESYTGEKGWYPEGWSIISNTSADDIATTETTFGWTVGTGTWAMMPGEGNAFTSINFQTFYTDEWLVTPAVHVSEGMELRYLYQIDEIFLYDLSNLDFSTWTFVGDPVCSADVRIMVSDDGGENWAQLKSYYESSVAGGNTVDDMLKETGIWRQETLSLADYAGKDVKIAVEYVGTNGNSVGIDKVMVGMPPLEVSYDSPVFTQFFGIDKVFTGWGNPIVTYPVFEPLTWDNSTFDDEVNYQWTYMDPDNGEGVDNDQDALTLTYHTDYHSDFSTTNNMYTLPVLHGTKAGFAEGLYSAPYQYMQMGGRPDLKSGDNFYEFGNMPFSTTAEGITLLNDYTENYDQVPMFGYNEFSDNYWSKYTFTDQEEINDQNYAHLTHIMNAYMTTQTPLVIKGVRVMGRGIVAEGAKFTIEIIPLTDEGTIVDTPLAVATATGADIIPTESGNEKKFLCVPFTLEAPVAISAADCAMYVIRFSGFRDADNVTYFAPYQSASASTLGMNHGFLQKDICWEGDLNTSLTQIANYTDLPQAFAIVTDSWYPWLQGADEVEAPAGETVTVPLDSYYDGADIAIEQLPEWLEASVAGRYGSCVLTLKSNGTPGTHADILLTAPGVRKIINVKAAEAGLNSIDADAAASEIVAYYDLQGRRVASASQAGLYIGRRADGSAVKVTTK